MTLGTQIIVLNSLRGKIFCTLVPIFCVLFVLLGVVDLYQQRQLAEEEIVKRAQSMAENLAYSSRLAVLTEDRSLLESALSSVTGAADFAYVSVYGERWTPLVDAASNSVNATRFKSPLDEKHKEHLQREGRTLSESYEAERKRFVEFIAPVVSVQSNVPFELQLESVDPNATEDDQERQKTIGAVRLGLSLARVDSHMASFLKWRGWSLAVFLALSTVVLYIFSGKITRPINRLTEQAKHMSQGLLEQAIPVTSRDEIGQLSASFNEMARSLRDLYSNLERKVAERTQQLTAANEKLSEASEHKSRFLANVNHELRTPLSSIISYARILRRDSAASITPLQLENLDDLLANAERLLTLIDGLLDIASIEAGKVNVHMTTVNVQEIFSEVRLNIQPMIKQAAVTLVQEIDSNISAVRTDRDKLRQILLNLAGNAAKVTERGEIRLSASHKGGNLQISVVDTGVGIAAEELDKIFDEFYRAHMRYDGNHRGTGLGLAIVKSLVTLLGGQITVKSQVGTGSCFTVTLPLERPDIYQA